VIVQRLELRDFRNYEHAVFALTAGTTAVVGDNAQGKTSLAEALAYLSTLESFRQVPPEAMIRLGADQAVVRAEVAHPDGRELLVEAELNRSGRNRVFVNRQRLVRSRDLLGVLRVTVFSPDDLALVKGGPAERRSFIDTALVLLTPKHDALRRDLDRILRQRNTLLKQAGGRLTDEIAFTLDVWDAKLAAAGDELGAARADALRALEPEVRAAYVALAGSSGAVDVSYDPPWRRTGLAAALAESRTMDVKRQISMVGPHRDDVALSVSGMPARTHASQGEQRSLALALRLGVHRLVTARTGIAPVLVLDDVLSELDDQRASALLGHLPAGQVLLTSASRLTPEARPDRVLHVRAGAVIDGDA
jgi:DNA replication and repair protein RecF